jgi:hypothetical protein
MSGAAHNGPTRSFADTAGAGGSSAAEAPKPQAKATASATSPSVAAGKCPYKPHAAAVSDSAASAGGYSGSQMIACGLTTAAVAVMVVGSLLRAQK